MNVGNPRSTEPRPQIAVSINHSSAAGFCSVIEYEMIRPLEILSISDLDLPRRIGFERISEQGSLAQIHADFGFMMARRHKLITRAKAARLHGCFVVLALNGDLRICVHWHGHRKLRADSLSHTRGGLDRFRIDLQVAGIVRA